MLRLKPLRILCLSVLVVVTSLNCANALASNSVATGSIGVRLVQIPDSVKSDPRSGYYIVARLLANEVFTQQLEVSNSTQSAASIDLYPAAATNVDGVFLPSGGNTQNELTSWTVVSPSHLIIPSNSVATVSVTISVPAYVASGEMYGVVWASDTGTPNSAGITSTNRVGIRMYDPIGPPPQAIKTGGSSSTPFDGIVSSSLYLVMAGLLSSVFWAFLYRRRRRKEVELQI